MQHLYLILFILLLLWLLAGRFVVVEWWLVKVLVVVVRVVVMVVCGCGLMMFFVWNFFCLFEVSMQKIINKLNLYISNLVTNHLKNKQFTILIFSIIQKKTLLCLCMWYVVINTCTYTYILYVYQIWLKLGHLNYARKPNR